jgi:ribosomal protein L9
VLLCIAGPQEKAQAQAFANALSTIGKFVLKKKVGEKDTIYGRWVLRCLLCKGRPA